VNGGPTFHQRLWPSSRKFLLRALAKSERGLRRACLHGLKGNSGLGERKYIENLSLTHWNARRSGGESGIE